ncbi:MAG: 16S rRNA (cytosine(1402)-N(4))-methyltransferase RsmH [Anaerolineales bacterium]|nr:16S rRNA (cytosine(1402)-N(4))-methyltransferase RsmH [Anaerolineales bacterium]
MVNPLVHLPVLYQEILTALQPRSGGRYIDCTLGAGGHAFGILESSCPDGQLLGLDVDPIALELAQQRLGDFGNRAILIRASYASLKNQLAIINWPKVDGILLDLGVSSMQLDEGKRGFSFMGDAPLDMRFDPQNPLSARDIVNDYSEQELADIIYRYGEEKRSRQIAQRIVRSRPINTTGELAHIIAGVAGGRRMKIHPATRTFQALRIAVNQELETLQKTLPQALDVLESGGRMAVISFHSLEDRIVKHFFRQESRDCICPPHTPICICGHHASIREMTRQPVKPQPSEIENNPRSRSARLRVAQKI